VTLAIIEGLVLSLAVAGSAFAWGHRLFLDWLDVAALLGQAAAVSLCCIVAFYYNDLYDLRVVRSFSLFTTRLLQSFGVAAGGERREIGLSTRVSFSNGKPVERFDPEGPKNPEGERRSVGRKRQLG